ncbi:endonuclease/exonuclease/phosphatase family protein [Streptomyces sp. NPDC001744]|uniref:endonuclease/exonuclease/phosphatase family protein n=1 Tax=Streptomyces sp. NPDC001744 TaxID=3364606 RepID=UPI003681407D
MTTTPVENGVTVPDARREPPPGTTAGSPAPPPRPPFRPFRSFRSFSLLRPSRAPRRGRATAVLSALLTLVLLGHGAIPDDPAHLGSLIETLLPWTGLAVVALLVVALLRRSPAAAVALALPAAAWLAVFGGAFVNDPRPGGDLTLVSHNVNQDNPDPGGTARSLLASGADVLALEELSPATAPAYERILAPSYPYHFYQGTVGIWSVFPLRDARALPIMPWTRALRATVETPSGPLNVHVAHLASVRVGPSGFTTRARDEALGLLAASVRAENAPRAVVMGDFNGSTDDRALRPLTSRMVPAHSSAGTGLGFTWPARFPVVRIDQILVRGVRATSSWELPATSSDHLPVAARIALGPDTAAGADR